MKVTPYLNFQGQCRPESTAESERVFNALADGGQITMPYGKTFWSEGFGMLVDRFDTPWMINCDQPCV